MIIVLHTFSPKANQSYKKEQYQEISGLLEVGA